MLAVASARSIRRPSPRFPKVPELPEVETIRRQLEPELEAAGSIAAEILDERWTRPEPPARIVAGLTGRTIETVGRRGKYLLLGLDDGATLVMHLRMTGNLLLAEPGEEEGHASARERLYGASTSPAHLRAELTLDDGRVLRFTDPRRFGHASLLAAGELDPYLDSRLGVEPLERRDDRRGDRADRGGPDGAAEVVPARPEGDRRGRQHLRRRGAPPRRAPSALAGRVDAPEHWEALREGIVEALEEGMRNGGASIDDYRDSRGEQGSMQDEFLVHTRAGQECPRCGERISRIVVSGRSTYFCPACQVRLRKRRKRKPKPRRRCAEPLPPPPGFAIGHWTAEAAPTGCTVILPPAGSRAGVDVRGGGPGTRETDIIGPLANPQEATAVLFTGGSAHGLAAADGVVRWCEEHGRGYATPGGLVPLVPAAVIYDLTAGAGVGAARPRARATRPARRPRGRPRARQRRRRSRRGGREGARPRAAGPGGVGYAAIRTGPGRDGRRARRRQRDRRRPRPRRRAARRPARRGRRDGPEHRDARRRRRAARLDRRPRPPEHDARLRDHRRRPRQAVLREGRADGERRRRPAVDPVFTPFDGDVVFCLASGDAESSPWSVIRVGSVAATLVAAAIRDGVRRPAADRGLVSPGRHP